MANVTGPRGGKNQGKAKDASHRSASTAAISVSETRQNSVPVAAAGGFAFGFLAGWAMRR